LFEFQVIAADFTDNNNEKLAEKSSSAQPGIGSLRHCCSLFSSKLELIREQDSER